MGLTDERTLCNALCGHLWEGGPPAHLIDYEVSTVHQQETVPATYTTVARQKLRVYNERLLEAQQ